MKKVYRLVVRCHDWRLGTTMTARLVWDLMIELILLEEAIRRSDELLEGVK
jgi:hypothetical protein